MKLFSTKFSSAWLFSHSMVYQGLLTTGLMSAFKGKSKIPIIASIEGNIMVPEMTSIDMILITNHAIKLERIIPPIFINTFTT